MLARHFSAAGCISACRAALLLGATFLTGCDGFSAFVSPQAAKADAPAPASDTLPALTEIAIGPPDARIMPGTRLQLTATGLYSDGSRRDLSAQVAWISADPSVAAVLTDPATLGTVIGMNPGSTTITVSDGALSRSIDVIVGHATLVSISVTPDTRTLAKGTRQQFAATGLYSDHTTQDLTRSATWTAEDPTLVSVGSLGAAAGNVQALQSGTTRVAATFEGVSGFGTLTVTPATLASVEVSPATRTIAKGLDARFTATGVYTDGTFQDITSQVSWESTTPAVASISKGMATAARTGTTRITASLSGVTGAAALAVTDALLASVEISPSSPSIANGLFTRLVATGRYTDNSTQTLTNVAVWSSSDPTVATVSNAAGFEGRADSSHPGSTTITAKVGALSGTTTLNVTAATLVSISVTPSAPTIAQGTQRQFTATGTYTDHSTQDLTTSVTWSSSSPTIAPISNSAGTNGLAAGASAGSTTITATLGTTSGSTTLTVTAATLASITVVPATPGIAKGTQQQFSATGIYSDSTTQDLTAAVTWSSSTTVIATISNAGGSMGLATSLEVGSTTISAALDGVTGSTQLTVSAATLVSIAVTPASTSIAKGTQRQFTATGTYTDHSTQNLTGSVTWGSSVLSIAPISNAGGSKGLATAASTGTTTVSATLGSVSGSTDLTVTPATLVSIAVTPASASAATNTQKQFSATGTYTDASTQNLTASVTWGSSSTSVATISNAPGSNGLAAAATAGTTSITATLGSVVSPAATLTVINGEAHVYAVNQNAGTVSQYKVETSGTLTPIGSGTVAAESNPIAITIDPQRRYAYVINQNSNSVSQYTVGTNGALTSLGVVAATGSAPISGVVEPAGKYFYAANYVDSTITQYAIGPSGALTPFGVDVATGTGPMYMAADPLGRALYVVNLDATISQFHIGPTGLLTAFATESTDIAPSGMVVEPGGRYAYVSNAQSNTITQYSIGTGGALSLIGPIATGNAPAGIAIDPTGHFVYTADYADDTVSAFSVSPGGTLSALGVKASGAGPYSVTVDPSGRYVYVANSSANTVSQYTIDVSGTLSDNGTAASGAYPVAVFSSY